MLTHLELAGFAGAWAWVDANRRHYALSLRLCIDGSQGQDVVGVSALTLASQMHRLIVPIVGIGNGAVTW